MLPFGKPFFIRKRKKKLTALREKTIVAPSSNHFQTNVNPMPVEIKIRKGESMDKAIRRMKKKLDRENIIRDVRAKRYFEKPCEERRRKKKVQAFNNMLRQRYENM